ncbi:MAG: glycosyltransferase [Candidatus Acidiferrales bacterium]
MRILKVVQAYYPFQEKGGPVVKVRAIALGLARRGHVVTVLTADLGFAPSAAPSMKAEKSAWGWRAEEEGVDAIFLRSYGHYRAVTFNPGVWSFCRRSLGDYDIVHIYGLYDLLGPAVASAARRKNIPYVIEPMGMFLPIVRSFRLKELYHTLFGKKMLRGANRLIATSEQEREELVAGGIAPSRIVVRRNGILIPSSLPCRGGFRERWNIPAGAKVVLYLGRIEPKKSPDLLLEAFALLRENTANATRSALVIAGPEQESSYSAHLRSLAASSGIGNRVIFTGPLYDDAKWAAYRDADVFVLPSQNENFGNSAAEAMVCGTPVIVTDRCGIAPMIGGKAGLVVPHDVDALAGALKTLLGNSDLAAQFRDGCREVVRGLSWDGPLSQMEQLYREAAATAGV